MRSVVIMLAMIHLPVLGLAEDSALPPTDEMLLRGTWQLASTTQQGVETKAIESADELPLTVTFEERTWSAKIGPKGAPIEISGGYALDSTQTPKLLDITIDNGGDSTSIAGIYKIEKGELHVRLPGSNGQRPVEFDIPAPDCTTIVFRRSPKS